MNAIKERCLRGLDSRGFAIALAALVVLGLAASPARSGEEYKPTSKVTKILKEDLATVAGQEARVLHIKLPPGYVGGKHSHPGDVFVYVKSGSLTIDLDSGTRTFAAGQVYHETPNAAMVARNVSTSEATTIVVFQVGKTGSPFAVKQK